MLIARNKWAGVESLSRRTLRIAFLHRKQNGIPYQHEASMLDNYTRLLAHIGRTREQIAATLQQLKSEVGLGE